jgi:hypothetical protein
MSWTQASCEACWLERNPGRRPHLLKNPDWEKCCYCGDQTQAGIYVREDPNKVPYPSGV